VSPLLATETRAVLPSHASEQNTPRTRSQNKLRPASQKKKEKKKKEKKRKKNPAESLNMSLW
jgi:hypothetical protein